MVFHWSLSDSKSPQVSRTLLSILAVLNNVVVWMISICPPTSKSSSPFSNPLFNVPNAPITIGIIVTCMFHSFLNSLARSRYLFFFSHSFSFCGQPGQQSRQFCKYYYYYYYYYYYCFTLCYFFATALDGGLSPFSMTFLSILAVVWRVSFRPYFYPLKTFQSAPITTGVTITFIFHNLLSSPAKSIYSSIFLAFYDFHSSKFLFFRCPPEN